MALNIQGAIRKFKVTIKGQAVVLDDPNPDFTPEEVLNFYTNTYPELTTATVAGPKVEDEAAVFTFVTTIGTKG